MRNWRVVQTSIWIQVEILGPETQSIVFFEAIEGGPKQVIC